MNINIAIDKKEMGERAAARGVELIQEAIQQRGKANIILATGASQFEMLGHLVQANVAWDAVTCFHLDEYIGLPEDHPASFRRYLRERFSNLVAVRDFHFIDGQTDVQRECQRLQDLIDEHPIDVAFIGIGENAHLAFNDPPADFETRQAYIQVELDDLCRRQQWSEGWFETLEDVPQTAISMSIRQIMKSRKIICSVPEKRKAIAVKAALGAAVVPDIPASILQEHPEVYLFLDRDSAELL